MLICKYCGKECKNENSHKNHERTCPKNPNRKYKNGMTGKNAWNKGLTKETDERVRKSANTLKERYDSGEIVSPYKGKRHSEEEKQHLSKIRKKYLSENPDKVPYILNHHSKGDSYPEKYFMELFKKLNILYHKDYYQSGYFLDFAWPDKKIYVEIDGEQHYSDKRIIEHDKIRTETLTNDSWKCIRRVRWKEYQKLSDNERRVFIEKLINDIKF